MRLLAASLPVVNAEIPDGQDLMNAVNYALFGILLEAMYW
jgi:hypothetical protein